LTRSETSVERRAEAPGEEHFVTVALSLSPIRDLGRCLEAGFDSVLPVPLESKTLDDALIRLTGPAVHEPELLDRLGGNRGLVRQLQDVLRRSMTAWQNDLDVAVHAGDSDRVRRTAHQMKGALANLAAGPAAAKAKMLEDLGKAGNLEPVSQVRTRLWTELVRVNADLTRISNAAEC
jgi:HPt (histidine-containing phosphotransfer) domain-containing protein